MSGKGLPFFRCTLCRGVVSVWDIYGPPHACPKCGGARITPTNLTFAEKIVQLAKHPKWWTWDEKQLLG
jgi:hypothetical protein